MAGVESSVQLHIDRGDNLDARDDKGQTPLMLSAARNKAAICKLLLSAGADPNLVDPFGRTALGIAKAAGATEAVLALEEACLLHPTTFAGNTPGDPAVAPLGEHCAKTQSVARPISARDSQFAPPVEPSHAEAASASSPDHPPALEFETDGLDLTGWEPEEDTPAPTSDPNISAAALEIQRSFNEHIPLDTSADWEDFDVFLPDRGAPLQDVDDAEVREQLRIVLLRAIREGSVPQASIEDLTRGDDGEPDAEACALLGMVINDLGAETDERFEYSAPHENFEVCVAPDEKPGEEDAVADALAFVDDLAARRNEPLRLYQRELQGRALLTAEAEVALGQAMERSVEKALDALAAWPAGIAATLEAARKVFKGVKPLRSMSYGREVRLQDAQAMSAAEIDLDTEVDATMAPPIAKDESAGSEDELDSRLGLDLNASIDELAKFRASTERLSSLPVGSSQDAAEWGACRDALTSLGLTRGFLMELADSELVRKPDSHHAFGQAMQAFRIARDQMAVANLKLVYSIAKKYLFSGQPLDDLLQEGNIGLIKAVDRYDWRRGFKFSTYATWWIRQQVGRFVADKGKTIRLPVHIYEKTQRIAQAAHAFELRHGHTPTLEEIAALVDLPVLKVEALSRMGVEPLPLHELPDIDGIIAVHAKELFAVRDPMEYIEDIQLGESVEYFLSTLRRKEENVVRMRYGIGVQDPMTLEEIGASMEVTRERIRQIEAKSLKQLRHPARLDRFLIEIGLAPKPRKRGGAQSDSETESEGEESPEQAKFVGAALKPEARANALPERRPGSDPSALEKLLAHIRAIGFAVVDAPDGPDRRIWVHITETPDNHSRKIVRKLLELGFEFWPGKGYWR